MSDWYDIAFNAFMADFQEQAGLTVEEARDAYSFLSNIGLIDYDIEKEVLYDTYFDESDED